MRKWQSCHSYINYEMIKKKKQCLSLSLRSQKLPDFKEGHLKSCLITAITNKPLSVVYCSLKY